MRLKKTMKMAMGLTLTAAMTLTLAGSAFAGEWKYEDNSWKYVKDDGTYAAGEWLWIDDNGDGISECYYFWGDGRCLTNITTPDGFTVDEIGAWIQDGAVETLTTGVEAAAAEAAAAAAENALTAAFAAQKAVADAYGVAENRFGDTMSGLSVRFMGGAVEDLGSAIKVNGADLLIPVILTEAPVSGKVYTSVKNIQTGEKFSYKCVALNTDEDGEKYALYKDTKTGELYYSEAKKGACLLCNSNDGVFTTVVTGPVYIAPDATCWFQLGGDETPVKDSAGVLDAGVFDGLTFDENGLISKMVHYGA